MRWPHYELPIVSPNNTSLRLSGAWNSFQNFGKTIHRFEFYDAENLWSSFMEYHYFLKITLPAGFGDTNTLPLPLIRYWYSYILTSRAKTTNRRKLKLWPLIFHPWPLTATQIHTHIHTQTNSFSPYDPPSVERTTTFYFVWISLHCSRFLNIMIHS